MAELLEKLMQKQQEEQSLRKEKDKCQNKVELATALISGLIEERENWKVSLKDRKADSKNLIGDTVICSGIIAYLGVFVKSYRDECVSQWVHMLNDFKI